MLHGVAEGCRGLLAVVFLGSGFMKLAARRSFEAALDSLGLASSRVRKGLSVAVPVAEVVGGMALLGPWYPRIVAGFLVLLLVVFTLVLTVQLVRGRVFSCQCFGPLSGERVSWWDVGRNALLLGAALLYIHISGESGPLDPKFMLLGVGLLLFGLLARAGLGLLESL